MDSLEEATAKQKAFNPKKFMIRGVPKKIFRVWYIKPHSETLNQHFCWPQLHPKLPPRFLPRHFSDLADAEFLCDPIVTGFSKHYQKKQSENELLYFGTDGEVLLSIIRVEVVS